jgi:5-methylcytosine-specific restriction protein B
MRTDLSEEVLARIWDYDVMPFIEDQLFGRTEELRSFRLAALRQGTDENNRAEGVPAADRDALEE